QPRAHDHGREPRRDLRPGRRSYRGPSPDELGVRGVAVNDPAWRSVSHMALVTPDMDTTVRFYAGVLGMPVVGAIMAGPMRHYFFKIGAHNTVAFFEIPEMETWAKGAGS